MLQDVRNAFGNKPLDVAVGQPVKAVLRRVLEGGEVALQRMRGEMDAAAAALKERQEKERLEWEERSAQDATGELVIYLTSLV